MSSSQRLLPRLYKTENNLSLTSFYFHFPITLVERKGWQWLPFRRLDKWGLQRFLYRQPIPEFLCPQSVCMDRLDLKKKDLEDRIWSNKFQKSWSLIRLCGSSGSDKIENLYSTKSQNSLILCQFIWIKKKRTEILFNKSQNLLLLCPFTFLVWIWRHKT